MNKIKYLLIVLVAVFICSCSEDDFDNPPAPSSFNNTGAVITDGVDNTTAVLLKENEEVAWDTLAWNAAVMYEDQGLITHYSIQIADSGSNFSSYFEIEASTTSETLIIITEGNLNTKLLENGYDPVQTYDLELRIKAFVHEDLETLYSDASAFTITTYKDVPVPEALFLFGDATTVAWGADTSLAMYKDGGKFIKFTYLESNKKFRFLKEQATEDNTYNFESVVNVPTNVSAAGDDDKNFMFTGATGWYKIEADYLTSTLIIETYEHNGHTYVEDYDKLYLVGSISGWDAQANPPQFEMTKLSEGSFSYEIALPDEAQFKFVLGNGQWSPNWANIGGMGNSGILGPEGANDNIEFDGGDKTYEIKVNIKQGTYTFTEVLPEYPEAMYLVGDGTAYGWDTPGTVDNAIMHKCASATGEGIYWKILHLEANTGFKVSAASWNDPNLGFGGADMDAEGVTVTDNGGNMQVAESGMYIVVLNLRDDMTKLSIKTAAVYGIGDAFGANDWAEDAASCLFTIDNTAKTLTSPALTADGNIRIYASHSWIPAWWNAEFNLFSGVIEYRNEGGDQDAVAGTTDQVVTLHFDDNTGSIQ